MNIITCDSAALVTTKVPSSKAGEPSCSGRTTNSNTGFFYLNSCLWVDRPSHPWARSLTDQMFWWTQEQTDSILTVKDRLTSDNHEDEPLVCSDLYLNLSQNIKMNWKYILTRTLISSEKNKLCCFNFRRHFYLHIKNSVVIQFKWFQLLFVSIWDLHTYDHC